VVISGKQRLLNRINKWIGAEVCVTGQCHRTVNGGSVLMPVAANRTLTWIAYVAGNNSTELVIYILGYIM